MLLGMFQDLLANWTDLEVSIYTGWNLSQLV